MTVPDYAPILVDLYDVHFQMILNHHRMQNNRIVMTNGCFDLVHPGHVDFLNRAKRHGDCLLVVVNSDESVRELKGNNRPIYTLDDRLFMLWSLKSVDFLMVSSESDLSPYISMIKPTVWVKGDDRNLLTLNPNERKAAEACGSKIVFLSRDREFSTTSVVEKLRNGGL